MIEVLQEVLLVEPLTEITANIVMEILPGNLFVIESAIAIMGRPRIEEQENGS